MPQVTPVLGAACPAVVGDGARDGTKGRTQNRSVQLPPDEDAYLRLRLPNAHGRVQPARRRVHWTASRRFRLRCASSALDGCSVADRCASGQTRTPKSLRTPGPKPASARLSRWAQSASWCRVRAQRRPVSSASAWSTAIRGSCVSNRLARVPELDSAEVPTRIRVCSPSVESRRSMVHRVLPSWLIRTRGSGSCATPLLIAGGRPRGQDVPAGTRSSNGLGHDSSLSVERSNCFCAPRKSMSSTCVWMRPSTTS